MMASMRCVMMSSWLRDVSLRCVGAYCGVEVWGVYGGVFIVVSKDYRKVCHWLAIVVSSIPLHFVATKGGCLRSSMA